MNDKTPKKAPDTQKAFNHDPNLIVVVGFCQKEFQPSVTTYMRAMLIMSWQVCPEQHKEEYPLAQTVMNMANGSYTLIEETPDELRQMMMGGH